MEYVLCSRHGVGCWGPTGEQDTAPVSNDAPNLMAGDRQGNVLLWPRVIRLWWQSRGADESVEEGIYSDLDAREDFLREMRSPMGPERETRVHTLKNWKKMIPERGNRCRLRVKKRQGVFGKCRKLNVVRKFDKWTWGELSLGRFSLDTVLRERKGIKGIRM